MLDGAVVHSQYPASSSEGSVEYNVILKYPEKTVLMLPIVSKLYSMNLFNWS